MADVDPRKYYDSGADYSGGKQSESSDEDKLGGAIKKKIKGGEDKLASKAVKYAKKAVKRSD